LNLLRNRDSAEEAAAAYDALADAVMRARGVMTGAGSPAKEQEVAWNLARVALTGFVEQFDGDLRLAFARLGSEDFDFDRLDMSAVINRNRDSLALTNVEAVALGGVLDKLAGDTKTNREMFDALDQQMSRSGVTWGQLTDEG